MKDTSVSIVNHEDSITIMLSEKVDGVWYKRKFIRVDKDFDVKAYKGKHGE